MDKQPRVTGWTRLEPYSRDESLRGGLRAEAHDPLWFLARQWQLGEFRGEDVGSPVQVRWQMMATPITRYQPGGIVSASPFQALRPGGVAPAPPFPGLLLDGVPLETLVERELVHGDVVNREWPPLRLRLAAEAGLHLLRLVGKDQRDALVSRFPLQVPADHPEQPLDDNSRRFLLVTAERVPDGGLLYSILQVVRGSTTLEKLVDPYRNQVSGGEQKWQQWQQQLAVAERTRIDQSVTDWLEWYESQFSEPGSTGPAHPSWIGERTEYKAAVAARFPPANAGEVGEELVLDAPEYHGGHLDWYSFNMLRSGSLGAQRTDLTREQLDHEEIKGGAIPVPVSFPGMPAPRWWEFEDARVDLGAVQVGPQDLVHLLLLEFALVYGNDWFVLPVEIPVGTLTRVQWLVVRDTFGDQTKILSAREVDRLLLPGKALLPWDMFRLAPDGRASSAGDREPPDALFLPPVLGPSLRGAPLEEILFLRDEMANLAWAVERIVESPAGRPINRSEEYQAARRRQQGQETTPAPARATGDQPTTFVYQLATPVPDYWVPLFPVRIRPGGSAIQFQRGGVPQGRVLEPERVPDNRPLLLNEEELPRAGARVTRAFRYARWIDGKTYLWVGRQKGAGRGEGSSGLRYDVLESVKPTLP
jgi:hypothetical protein